MKKEQYYKVYQAWGDMKYKCNNPKCKTYPKFGGSGIGYSKEWENYDTFRADVLPEFLELFEKGIPPKKITLGRIDPNKDFSATNFKWISPFEQAVSLNPQQLNFVVAQRVGENKKVFPSLKDMAEFYGVARTGASNALHKGTNYVKNIIFSVISKEEYLKALEDEIYLNLLDIKYDKNAYERNEIRNRKIAENKANK